MRMVSMQLMLPTDCQEQELQKMTVAAQEAAQKLQVTLADVKVHVSGAVIALLRQQRRLQKCGLRLQTLRCRRAPVSRL